MTIPGEAAKSAAGGRASGKKVRVRDTTEESKIWYIKLVIVFVCDIVACGAYCKSSGSLSGAGFLQLLRCFVGPLGELLTSGLVGLQVGDGMV
jgi:hypothetical protein